MNATDDLDIVATEIDILETKPLKKVVEYPVHHMDVEVHPKSGNIGKQKCLYCQNPTSEDEHQIVLGEDFGSCKSVSFRIIYDKKLTQHILTCEIEYTDMDGMQTTYFGESKAISRCPICGREL